MEKNLTFVMEDYFNCSSYFSKEYFTKFLNLFFVEILENNKINTKELIIKSLVLQ